MWVVWWLSGRASDIQSGGHKFDSWSGRCSVTGQVVYTHMPLWPSIIIWYRRKLWQTGTPCDPLALYPWSHSASWCLAEGYRNGDQHHVAVEGLVFFLLFKNNTACVRWLRVNRWLGWRDQVRRNWRSRSPCVQQVRLSCILRTPSGFSPIVTCQSNSTSGATSW